MNADYERLRGRLHTKLKKKAARWLAGKDWQRVEDVVRRFEASDLDSRVDLGGLPPGSKPLTGRAKAKRGAELLALELAELLVADGTCEVRDGESGQEIRLRPDVVEPQAEGETDLTPAPADPGETTPHGERCAVVADDQAPAADADRQLDAVEPAPAETPSETLAAGQADKPATAVPASVHGPDAAALPAPSTTAAEVVRLPVAGLRPHHVAADVPPMRAEEWESFVADVKARGVLDPLTVQHDSDGGVVLDGRHRLRAAQEAGLADVPVLLVDLSADEQVACVYRTALLRRHLNDDQRAVLAARWAAAEAKKARTERATKAGLAGGRGRSGSKAKDSSGDVSSPELSAFDAKGDDQETKSGAPRARERAAVQHAVPERRLRAAAELDRRTPELAASTLAGEMPMRQARRAARPASGVTRKDKPPTKPIGGEPATTQAPDATTDASVSGAAQPTPQEPATPDATGMAATVPMTVTLPLDPQALLDALLGCMSVSEADEVLRQTTALVKAAVERKDKEDAPGQPPPFSSQEGAAAVADEPVETPAA